jgi:nitrogen PTS system EIIA component
MMAGRRPAADREPLVEITDLVTPERAIISLQARSKPHLLIELARRAATATGLPQKRIADALQARESLGSTGVGAGIAIPHARIAGIGQFYGLFVRLRPSIDYDAVDGQPVDLVFLLLIPANSKEHLQALAAISRRLRDHTVASALRSAITGQDLFQIITGKN